MRLSRLALGIALSLAAACGDDGGNDTIDAGPDAPTGAPTVAITSHTDGQRVIGSRTVTIAGTLVDTATITSVTITVGTAAPVAATFDQTSFSASVALADNTHTVTVTATDATTATGTDDVTLTYPFVSLGNFERASMVLGQSTFTENAARAADAGRIQDAYGRATEIGGILYVADTSGDRVLGFRGFPAQDGANADFVLGQSSFTSAVPGTTTPGRLDAPQSVVGHAGKLYVLEYRNARISVWSTTPTTTAVPADGVIGQADLSSRDTSCTSTRFFNPEDMTIGGDRLIVADSDHNRILIWNTVPAAADTPADLVLGQGDFTHCTSDDDDQDGVDDGAAGARTLAYPTSVWSDGTRLVVVDLDNSRVLLWNTFPTTSFQPADVILGQPDATSNGADVGPDHVAYPYMVESNGNQLFVADSDNNRVLVWNTFPTSNVPADVVLGQSDFTHATSNDDDQNDVTDAPSSRTFDYPSAVWLVRDRLFVTDNSNTRVLMFGAPVCTLNTGLYEYPAGSGTCIDDPCTPSTCTNYRTCDRSTGTAECVCPAGIGGDCDSCVLRVDPDATGAGTGASWADAYTTLAPALSAGAQIAIPCDVWVAEGTYYVYGGAETDTLTLDGTVSIRGGFAGTESSAAARSGGATIFDGRAAAGSTNDVRHVVTVISAGVTQPPGLDRVTIQYGNADGTGNDGNGGGVLVTNGARLTLTDSRLENNRAAIAGGGLSAQTSGATAVTIDNSVVTRNQAGRSGGGASLSGGTVVDSQFSDNTVGTAVGHAGGGLAVSGTGTITRTSFTRNRATGDAGALWARGPSTAWTITDSSFVSNQGNNGGAVYFDAAGAGCAMRRSLIAGNTALGTAGGVFVRDSGPTLENLTIAGNVASSSGTGLDNSGSSGTYSNLIVWGNAGTSTQYFGSAPTVAYSDIAGGVAGTGNIDSDPLFVHAPSQIDRLVSQIAADIMTVTTGARFAIGDHIEIGNDGVARQVTLVAGNAVTFTPALAASPLDVTVENWGAESANLVADYHLGAGSPCIDAGTPAGTDIGAYP